jgi:TM2 domain-containing membrane protein YozV
VTETSLDQSAASSGNEKKHYPALAIALAGWFIPGAGHLLLGRWGRAFLFFCVVGGLAFTGFLLRGQVFPPHSEDPFGTLGFLADACSGVFFLLAHLVEKAGPDVSRAAGDYGTRFVAAAGLINLLTLLDAYGIAMGRRQ